MSELAHLMEETPGGPNHGYRARASLPSQSIHVPSEFGGRQDGRAMEALDPAAVQRGEFLREGGWSPVTATAHRGVLHPEEHVDADALQGMVEAELGFTYEQVRSVYRQGPLGATQRELRGAIDARVLALSRAGANVALLGRALGFPVKDNGNCRAMENALARARAEEVT